MKKPSEMDLSSLSLDDLMQGIEAVHLAVRNSVETWLDSEGYYPGTTRVSAHQLYAKYVEWLALNPEAGRNPGIRNWGKLMSGRLKRGRGKDGSHYYISRESLADLGGR